MRTPPTLFLLLQVGETLSWEQNILSVMVEPLTTPECSEKKETLASGKWPERPWSDSSGGSEVSGQGCPLGAAIPLSHP